MKGKNIVNLTIQLKQRTPVFLVVVLLVCFVQVHELTRRGADQLKDDNLFHWNVALIVLNQDSLYYGGYFKV